MQKAESTCLACVSHYHIIITTALGIFFCASLLKNCERFFVSEIDPFGGKKICKKQSTCLACVSHYHIINNSIYLFSAIYTHTYTTETFLLRLCVVTARVIKAPRQR